MQKRELFLAISIVLIFIAGTSFFFILSQTMKIPITGFANIGSITLFIKTPEVVVTIWSPLNVTYNFNIGSNYTLDLNVSTTNLDIDSWWYTLEDLRHGTVAASNITFIPNSTLNAVRWSNKLTVFANSTSGTIGSSSVIFYIDVPNSAPLIQGIDPDIYVCERRVLVYPFNVYNPDEDNLSLTISPQSIFFLSPDSFIAQTNPKSFILSGLLGKSNIGKYSEAISVTDGQFADTVNTNITVIEINNPPVMADIGVQTVWSHGDNSNFYKEISVTDVEDGNSMVGNLTLNLTFLNGSPFFSMSSKGVINFTANESVLGNYNLSVCATDKSLSSISPNISLCGQTGLAQTTCKNFSLTVTKENRAPYFTSWYPTFFDLNISGNDILYFNTTSADPDGNVPDTYWYLDNKSLSKTLNNSFSSITEILGCGVSGIHAIKSEITDGLLNKSLIWTINVTQVICPSSVGGGSAGAGGGGANINCAPLEVCGNWNICQNLDTSLKESTVKNNDYVGFKSSCVSVGLVSDNCGFQTRNCLDLHYCNFTQSFLPQSQMCEFTLKPTCSDGIKNCHDGSCEVLTDCGGPCSACATCSDKIQNQGEKGIDCGGP